MTGCVKTAAAEESTDPSCARPLILTVEPASVSFWFCLAAAAAARSPASAVSAVS